MNATVTLPILLHLRYDCAVAQRMPSAVLDGLSQIDDSNLFASSCAHRLECSLTTINQAATTPPILAV